jgi:hypothetical protein
VTERARLSVQVEPELEQDLRAAAKQRGIRLSDMIRECIKVGFQQSARADQVVEQIKTASRIKANPFGE